VRSIRNLVTLLALALPAGPLAAQNIVKWDTSLRGQTGQRSLFLRTPSGGNFGLPLGAGDVNGDSREDILLCAFANSEAFLFFQPPVNAGDQESVPQAGVVTRISGVQSLGVECAAGDVDGDGLADLVIGAPNANAPGRASVGAVYVVFGTPALPAQVDVRSAPGVLTITGLDGGDHFGVWIDVVDVDGDGVEDILAGSPDGDGPANDRQNAGEAYVIYGGASLTAGAVELSALIGGGRVFTVWGADVGDKTGSTIHAGRIDDDGVADLAVGSALNRAAVVVFNGSVGAGDGPDGARDDAGEVALVFDPSPGASLDLAAPPADVAFIFGADEDDFMGEEVNVGDADGDGFGDVLVGALTGDGFENLRPFVGEAYLVYGGPSLRGRRIDLREPPSGVTAIYGPTAGGITGDTARLLDVDGDGRDDVFVGSPTGTFLGDDGRPRTGALFFVRSPAGHLPAVIQLDHPPLATLPFGVILAADPGDILSYSLTRANVDGDGADDVVVNAMTGDGLNNLAVDAGEAYVITGAALAAHLEPFASGDLDGDGRSDARDLQRATGALAGRGSLSDTELARADVNGNGDLDAGDLVGLVDRVLDRNLLAPGALGTGSLAKEAPPPEYRYEEPGEQGGVGYSMLGLGRVPVAGTVASGAAVTAATSGAFSLVGAKAAAGRAAAPDLALGALQVTFAMPAGLVTPPQLVSTAGQHMVAGSVGGKLRVLVLSTTEIPTDVPLFRFVGSRPRLESVKAATRGGSLRVLRADRR
jgi:hypothetical protein